MTSRKTNQKQKNDILVNNKLNKYGEIHTEICMQVKKQQLELDMEQQTGSKSTKEYVKAVYCHSAYLVYMKSTSCEMPG